jgi:hypothetical protein
MPALNGQSVGRSKTIAVKLRSSSKEISREKNQNGIWEKKNRCRQENRRCHHHACVPFDFAQGTAVRAESRTMMRRAARPEGICQHEASADWRVKARASR